MTTTMPEPSTVDVVMVVVPFPTQGHLNQLLHFCHFVCSYDIPVHFIGSVTHNRQVRSRLHGWNPVAFPNLQFHDFPIPAYAVPPPNPHSPIKFPSHLQPAFDAALLHLRPHLSLLIRSLSAITGRVVVVHDSLMSFAANLSADLPNVESYAFHSVSAFATLLFQWESRGIMMEQSMKICPNVPVVGSDGCFTLEFVEFVRRQHKLTAAGDGRIINTCRPIEAKFIDLFAKEPNLQNKPLFAIGPLNPVALEEHDKEEDIHLNVVPRKRHECLRWLDKQPEFSVIYVSFGTTSTLCCRQINELSSGLDRSQQKFLWVPRDADKGDIFEGESFSSSVSEDEMMAKKPSVVPTLATKGKGIVLRGWAPQLEILGHPAVGGFMTHCGWNSCIESMSFGVPMAVWPMHSEQPRCAVLVTEILRVGIPVRDWGRRDEVVTAEAVESVINRLMGLPEGSEVRSRAKSLGCSIRQASFDGGDSKKELESFISHICRP